MKKYEVTYCEKLRSRDNKQPITTIYAEDYDHAKEVAVKTVLISSQYLNIKELKSW